jgi:GDP-4-dehydro-6-deoxy-D-mannose reductase
VRAFLTGGQGFVGRWLQAELRAAGDEVVAPPPELDVLDAPGLRDAVAAARPDAVYHLAALTHVGYSWAHPGEVFKVNALGTLNLLEAVRAAASDPRVVVVSSAEVYGMVADDEIPITESAPLAPVTPYAVSKVAAEYLAIQAHLAHSTGAVRVRPFNHVGPGQSPDFAVSALARRVVEAERSGSGALKVGNLSAMRDFTDVRDVVAAYRALVKGGAAGEVYNVCSGRAVAISEVAERLVAQAERPLELEVDPELLRPSDIPVLEGDPARIKGAVGWAPRISLEDTLAAVLDHWRQAVSAPAGGPP